MNGKYTKFLQDTSGFVLIAIGMFFLFAITVEFLETSLVLFAVLLVYIAYCWRGPSGDRSQEGKNAG